jgi:two-component system, OmpR family, sensor histidine kinase CpxA
MIMLIKNGLSSIAAKLFLWFWLIAILSMFLAYLITAQFDNNSQILPAQRDDMRILHNIARYNNRHRVASIADFFQQLRPRINNKIWLKDLKNQQVYSPHSNNKLLNDYLLQNNLTDAITVQFKKLRLTGPLPLVINQNNYQIFIANLTPHKPPHLLIRRIPLWLRIASTVVISFILLWLLARSLSKPLLKIQQAANELGNGKLTTRITTLNQRNDELGQLANSFNKMATKLENSIGAQQRLLADVSHELRSPMTRLQIAIGLAHKSTHAPDELANHLQRCETEISRLDTMLDNVIALSRSENTLPHFSSTRFYFNKLIEDLVDDAQFIANEKNINISLKQAKNIKITGDEQLLASAIGNILSNAVKYSANNSNITVIITELQQQLIIKVKDAGIGVPESSLAQLFEPFYRVQSHRSRATGGAGLGLAIAKQAILAHHGTINAYNNCATSNQDAVHGLTVEIKLPKN